MSLLFGAGWARGVGMYALILIVFLSSTHIKNYYYPQDDAPKEASDDDSSPTGALQPNANQTISNITLTFRVPRSDRMGSRIQLPLAAWMVARFHGWNFCSPYDAMTVALSFPMCFDEYDPQGLLKVGPEREYGDEGSPNEGAGVYYINSNRHNLWATVAAHEGGGQVSMLDDGFKQEWRRRIMESTVRPELEGDLWLHKDSIKLAVHARRGDILPGKRNDAWISDNQLIALIEVSKYYIQQKLGNETKMEVHVFSESYGATDWNRYGSLVDKFHLAPYGSGDIQLNLRDWKHFVKADMLVIGGSFSRMPAFARPNPSPDTGLPMTFAWNGRERGWVNWAYVRRDLGIMAIPIPGLGGQVVAYSAPDKMSDTSKFEKLLPIKSIIGNIYGTGWKR